MTTPEFSKSGNSDTMRVCPNCWDNNPANATECRQCGLVLGAAAVDKPRLCPAGHPMDPTWKVCAFCKANGTIPESAPAKSEAALEGAPSHRRTVVETDSRFVSGTHPVPTARIPAPQSPSGQFRAIPSAANSPASQSLSSTPGGTPLRRTSYIPASGPNPSGAPAPARKIVGILITYTWKPEGQIFPVREGRNIIGRDPQQADIVIEQDDTLSAMNSYIIFRTKFVIGDQPSMGGTDVNNEPVEQPFHPLPNYSKIRTGSTIWTFIAIEPGDWGIKPD